MKDMKLFYDEADGIVHGSSDVFEKEALDQFKRAFNVKTQIAIGPYSYEMEPPPRDTSTLALEVDAFLNKALSDTGPQSVFYVS